MKPFFEAMFFNPKWYHYIAMIVLLPFSMLYGMVMLLRRAFTAKQKFSIPIVSIGNLMVGGSGKTPFVIALALRCKDVTIISRGYGRQTQGYIEVSSHGKILASVQDSGDEAMLMAMSLPNASVIVCEDRGMAIEVAIREGAKLILLDDGFNRVEIKKFEILLEPECLPNILPFPAGGLREFYMTRHFADIIGKENRDFTRVVDVENVTKRMVLVTAIANPKRLDDYLPEGVVKKITLDDHAYFDKSNLEEYLKTYEADSILVTEKDAVKMKDFRLPLSVMKLELEIEDKLLLSVDNYVKNFK